MEAGFWEEEKTGKLRAIRRQRACLRCRVHRIKVPNRHHTPTRGSRVSTTLKLIGAQFSPKDSYLRCMSSAVKDWGVRGLRIRHSVDTSLVDSIVFNTGKQHRTVTQPKGLAYMIVS
jgi:hypothetical protein